MKTYLIQVNYGWSEYELEHFPYYSVWEIEAHNKKEAIYKCKLDCDHQYLGGELNIPMYYKLLKIGIKEKVNRDEGWDIINL